MKTTTHERVGRCKRCGRCCRELKITIPTWKDVELAPDVPVHTRRQLLSALDEFGFTVLSVVERHRSCYGEKSVLWEVHVRCRNQRDDGSCSTYRGKRPWFCVVLRGLAVRPGRDAEVVRLQVEEGGAVKLHRGDKAAIRKSIAHWRRMRRDARGAHESPTATNCALCEKYPALGCFDAAGRRCPVFRASGQFGCATTPYNAANSAWRAYVMRGDDSAEDRWHRAADAEIGFLEGLLE